MIAFNSISDALGAVRDLAFNPPAGLPADVADRMRAIAAEISPVTAIVDGAELIFARREDLDADQLRLGAGLISFATENGWHGLAADGRGVGILRALRRDAGDEPVNGDWPDPADDPEIQPRFSKPE